MMNRLQGGNEKTELPQRSNPLMQVTKKTIPEFFPGTTDDGRTTFQIVKALDRLAGEPGIPRH